MTDKDYEIICDECIARGQNVSVESNGNIINECERCYLWEYGCEKE